MMSSQLCCFKHCPVKNNIRTFFTSQKVAEQFQLCLTLNQMNKLLTSQVIPVQLCWTHFNMVMNKKTIRDTQCTVPKNVTVASSSVHKVPQPSNEVVIDLVNDKEDDLSTNIGILHNYSKSSPAIKSKVIDKENQPDVNSMQKTKLNPTSNIQLKFDKFVPNIIQDVQKSVQAKEPRIEPNDSSELLVKPDTTGKTPIVQKTIGKVSMVSALKSKYLESKAKVLVDACGTRFKVVNLNDYKKVRQVKMRPSENSSPLILDNLTKFKKPEPENTSDFALSVSTGERDAAKPDKAAIEKSSSDLCRICANYMDADTLINIFDEINSNKVEKIEKCFPDKVTKENGLPVKMCKACWEQIEKFAEFIDTFNRAEKWLRTMVKKKEPQPKFVVNLKEAVASESAAVGAEPEQGQEPAPAPAPAPASQEIQHQCLLCGSLLPNKQEAIQHAVRIHKSAGCDRLFFKILHGKNKEKRRYHCMTCKQWFSTWSGYRAHRHHWRQHVCDICKQGFKLRSELVAHRRKHSPSYECDQCTEKFSEELELARHKDTHGSMMPRTCACCNRSYHTHLAYYRHTRNQKNFLCWVCGRTFGSRSHLQTHVLGHTEGVHFQCSQCPKKFKQASALRSHSEVHGERKYVCQVCGRRYTTINRLKAHARLHTRSVQPAPPRNLKCEVCGRAFSYQRELHNHKKRHELLQDEEEADGLQPGVRTCHVCGKIARSRYALQCHLFTHSTQPGPFNCSACGKQVRTLQRLFKHIRSLCGLRPFSCECGKRFKLNGFLQRHKPHCWIKKWRPPTDSVEETIEAVATGGRAVTPPVPTLTP